MPEIKEVTLDEALKIAKEKGTVMVWLGTEPVEYVRELIGVERGKLVQGNPLMIATLSKDEAERFSEHVFICYHGNTSMRVAKTLLSNYNINSYSLKGGVTAIVGEVF